jgi:hypothetical protein
MDTLQAILKINPSARVNVIKRRGEEEVITWLEGTAEISTADIDAKKAELAYVEPREREYPTIADQLDMQYHDLVDGTTTWKDAVEAVKDAHPKGGS